MSDSADPPGRFVSPSRGLALSLSHIWRLALDLLFPPRCVSCGRHGAWLCRRCRDAVQPILPPVCIHCGQRLTAAAPCRSCGMHKPAINGLRSAAVFGGPLRKAIHSFKYNGLRDLSGPLGGILAGAFTRYAPPADVLIPVPLHRARQRQRGFNQSLLLAAELSAHTGLPLARDELVRWRQTKSQVDLGAAQRRENVMDAFAWRGGSLEGHHALLIDDVCTTGSTLEACAAALYAAGAATVWGLTLAREQFGAGERPGQRN